MMAFTMLLTDVGPWPGVICDQCRKACSLATARILWGPGSLDFDGDEEPYTTASPDDGPFSPVSVLTVCSPECAAEARAIREGEPDELEDGWVPAVQFIGRLLVDAERAAAPVGA